MITPTKSDIHRKVYYRDYLKVDGASTGRWIEGQIEAIGRMTILVEFKDGGRAICRSDLEWAVP
jgi:hypothetical protein